MASILIIDDDQDITKILTRFLGKHNYDCTTALTANDGLTNLKKQDYDLVLADFRLPDMDGLELLKSIKSEHPQQKVVTITGYSDVRMAVKIMQEGALDYVTKPLYPEEILKLVKSVVEGSATGAPQQNGSAGSNGTLTQTAPTETRRKRSLPKTDFNYVLGDSAQSKKTFDDIQIIAPTNMSVIINGETGTGKEFVAKAIHQYSKRSDKPFVAVDCGAIPRDIASSELFGHEKGAFTGAVSSKNGKFQQANGGTLFLDEIGNLTYETQIKLLRVLQERVVTRVGGEKELPVDVRIIAATNEDLRQAVKDGEFREDLFHRLNEFSIKISALRNRKDDIVTFSQHFINMANDDLEKDVHEIDDDVMEKLLGYAWPGNLRELKNVIKRSVLLAPGDTIVESCLPEEILYQHEDDTDLNGSDLKNAAEAAERRAILDALSQCGNNKSKAAKMLNIDRKTLYNKLKSYDLGS